MELSQQIVELESRLVEHEAREQETREQEVKEQATKEEEERRKGDPATLRMSRENSRLTIPKQSSRMDLVAEAALSASQISSAREEKRKAEEELRGATEGGDGDEGGA